MKAKSKRPSVTALRNKMDKLWATKDKEGAVCEVCQRKEGQLHPHHFIGRKNMRLRWDLRNRVWLCPTHHTFGNKSAHNDPVWFLEWMAMNRGEDFSHCDTVKNELIKSADYERIYEELKKA